MATRSMQSTAPNAVRLGRLLGSTCALALLPHAASASPERVEASDYWRVVEVVGEAQMLTGANPWNEPETLEVGDVVGPYQAIETLAGSTAILTRADDVMVVYENTTITLPPPSPDHAETQIEQLGGEAFYSVEPRPDPQFTVETPLMVAGVKGTEFAIVDNGGRLEVAHGVVDVEDRGLGDRRDVPAGQGIGVQALAQDFSPQPLNSAAVERWTSLSNAIEASTEVMTEAADELAEAEAETASEVTANSSNNGNGNGNSGNNGNGNGNSGNNGNGNGNSGNNGNGNGNSGNNGNGNGNSGNNGNGNGNSGNNGNGNGNSGNNGNGNGNSGNNGNGNGNNGNGNGNN